MRFDFIFMLTRGDRTVVNARSHVATAIAAGVRHVGFKDIGVPFDVLRNLHDEIKSGGATSYLEVVSLDAASEIKSAQMAVDLGVDYLLGGTRAGAVIPILDGSDIQYYPFPGRITGHPGRLEGSVKDICNSAIALAAMEAVDGLDLLAWRSHHHGADLARSVCEVVDVPVIVAGSMNSPRCVDEVRCAGAAGFTVGTAALDGVFKGAGAALSSQLSSIQAVCDGSKHAA